MSDFPVETPLLTDALIAQIHRDNAEVGTKEFAYGTMFRHSDATRCGRAMGYRYLSQLAEKDDDEAELFMYEPPDIAGEWVMWLGTMIHEKLQAALEERFGSQVEIEVKVRHDDLSSGHLDALVHNVPGVGRICYELKTKGGYGFDKAIGIDRRAYKEIMPEGPGAAAKTQGALNALAVDADLLVIGVIGMEAISKQLRQRVGWNDLRAIVSEWHYPRTEYVPWAQMELERMTGLAEELVAGCVPERKAIGDEMQVLELDPEAQRPSWMCSYCGYRLVCVSHGPGRIML
jgi:hypothetical protein